MAELRATPYANPLTGLSNDAIQGLLAFMQDKRRTQQLQGLGNLLESTGIPKTVERAAYAESPRGLLDALTNVNRANVPFLKPETAEALLTVAPLPRGAGKVAMAAGRASERVAERVVPGIMERGGLPAEMLGAMANRTMSPLDVYHGTPHRFAPTARNPLGEFDASKIGTGEGNQSFGHGLYFAENPNVAKEYQNQLSGYSANGKRLPSDMGTVLSNFGGDVGAAIIEKQNQLNKWLQTSGDEKHFIVKGLKDEIKELSKLQGKSLESTGALYKVDLPDEQIAKMLDYDKTWKQQPKNVQDAINVDNLLKYYGTDDISTSQVLYHAKQNMSPAAFAEFLRSKGVPGVKYLDEGSRQSGQGTRNFVVFPGEEKSMTILERNGLLADQFEALPVEKKKEILSLLE